MQLSLSLLYKNYNDFNRDIFEGKLPQVPIIINHSVRNLGQLCFKDERKGHSLIRKLTHIAISDAFDRDMSNVEDTLIHEMIHVRQVIEGIYDEETPHGPFFRREMERINREFGRNIQVRGHKGDKEAPKHDAIRVHYFFVIKFNDGGTYIGKVASTRLFEINELLTKDFKNQTSELRWYGSLCPELNGMPRCVKLKFYKVPDDLLNRILGHLTTTEMEFTADRFLPVSNNLPQ